MKILRNLIRIIRLSSVIFSITNITELNSDNKILILRLSKKGKEKEAIIFLKLRSNIRKRSIKKGEPFKRISRSLIIISEFSIKFIKSFAEFIKPFASLFTKFYKFKKLFINLYEGRTLKEDIKYFTEYKRIR